MAACRVCLSLLAPGITAKADCRQEFVTKNLKPVLKCRHKERVGRGVSWHLSTVFILMKLRVCGRATEARTSTEAGSAALPDIGHIAGATWRNCHARRSETQALARRTAIRLRTQLE